MPGKPTLNYPRVNRTIQLQLEDPAQAHVNEEIQKLVNTGRWQKWIRGLLVEHFPLPAQPENGHGEPSGDSEA